MRKINIYLMLLFAAMFFTIPIFAQEDVSKDIEDVILTEELEEGVITGKVVSVDIDSGTITVKIEEGAEKTFSVVTDETILWKGIEDIELSDIEEGQAAEVGYYTDESGALIASWVDILVEEEAQETALPELEEEEDILEPEAITEPEEQISPEEQYEQQ